MNKFKLALVSAAAAALLVPAAAQAQLSATPAVAVHTEHPLMPPAETQSQLSFNIGAVSLYKSSGVDQNWTEGKNSKNFSPAIQGGVDYAFSNGFYVGNWNSTGKFSDANLEIDLYAGLRGELTKDLNYDVGFARYIYPSSGGGWNGNEVYFSLSYAGFLTKITRGVSGSIDQHTRFSLGYTRPLSDKLTLTAGLGLRDDHAGNFDDYSLGLSYDLGNALSLSGNLAGATKKDEDSKNRRDNRLMVGISKSF